MRRRQEGRGEPGVQSQDIRSSAKSKYASCTAPVAVAPPLAHVSPIAYLIALISWTRTNALAASYANVSLLLLGMWCRSFLVKKTEIHGDLPSSTAGSPRPGPWLAFCYQNHVYCLIMMNCVCIGVEPVAIFFQARECLSPLSAGR